ncbi:MAG: carcinine hydrolase/isopenicillin-N N-acyltransferase family protein [Thermoguttaceae bacterium]
MSEPADPVSEPLSKTTLPTDSTRGRWRRLKWAAIATLVLLVIAAFLVKDYVRTLYSLRRVPGTNAFVMDYYVDYHIDKIRNRGMDVDNIEDSCITTLFPDFIQPIATRMKRAYLPNQIKVVEESHGHCSTVALRSQNGNVFFGRNLDFANDACLILRIHDQNGLASISVIDLAYLNLNRADLDQTGLLTRLPLLFAPYYAMDGVNRYGVAVSDMSVHPAEPPVNPNHPAIILSTLERLILDYAHNADKAVDLVRAFNVHFVVTPEHLMVADASGRSRIIEFIDGNIRVTPAEGPWQICTNDIVWRKSELERTNSCSRYRTGSEAAKKLGGVVGYADARRVARSMSVANWTMWTSVYNLTTGEAHVLYKSGLDTEYCDAIPLVSGDEQTHPREPVAGPTANAKLP